MGHELDFWYAKVSSLVKDASGLDLTNDEILEVGIKPALVEHFQVSPREVTTEAPGAGSAYFPLPTGWAPGVSVITQVEYPARQDPVCQYRPPFLDRRSWRLGGSLADPAVQQVILDRTVPTGQYVRFTFLAPWPVPVTGDDTADAIPETQFEAVAMLAASYCCESMTALASRSRSGAWPTDFADGSTRSAHLATMADRYRSRYESMVDRRITVA